jgi:hypothetical protein
LATHVHPATTTSAHPLVLYILIRQLQLACNSTSTGFSKSFTSSAFPVPVLLYAHSGWLPGKAASHHILRLYLLEKREHPNLVFRLTVEMTFVLVSTSAFYLFRNRFQTLLPVAHG